MRDNPRLFRVVKNVDPRLQDQIDVLRFQLGEVRRLCRYFLWALLVLACAVGVCLATMG